MELCQSKQPKKVGVSFLGGSDVVVGRHDVADLVRVLLVYAGQGQVGETSCGLGVEDRLFGGDEGRRANEQHENGEQAVHGDTSHSSAVDTTVA